ncbi:MAG: hypothetical protein AAF202_11055, partial [Pseudomonadota bacterium]
MFQDETRSFVRVFSLAFTFLLVLLFQNCASEDVDMSSSDLASQSVTLEKAPIVDMTMTGGDEIYEGARLVFKSDLQDPSLEYTWYFRPAVSGPLVVQDSSNHELSIQGVRQHQSGDYWVEVTDSEGASAKSNEIKVNVRRSPFKTQPSSTRKSIEVSATFKAELRNTTGLSYHWQVKKSGQSSFKNLSTTNSRITGVKTKTLKISNIQATDRGLYRLSLRSGSGSTARYLNSASAQLAVVTDTLESARVKPDAKLELTVAMRGLKKQGNSVTTTVDGDQHWQRYDQNSKTWQNFVRNSVQVKGRKLVVDSFNPRYRKYRIYINTVKGKVYSPANTITPL